MNLDSATGADVGFASAVLALPAGVPVRCRFTVDIVSIDPETSTTRVQASASPTQGNGNHENAVFWPGENAPSASLVLTLPSEIEHSFREEHEFWADLTLIQPVHQDKE